MSPSNPISHTGTMHDPTTKCPHCQGDIQLKDLNCRSCGHAIRTQPLLGEVLIDERIVTRDQLEQALKLQQRKLGEILVDIGACKAEDLEKAFHVQARGRTRADMAQADLKRARLVIGALVLVVAGMGFSLFQSTSRTRLMNRMEREELTVPEVVAIMEEAESPFKFDALRSISRHLSDPAAASVIERALRTERWYVKLYAAMLARDTMNPKMIPPLIALLTDANVGAVAHQALMAISGQRLERAQGPWIAWAHTQGMKVDDPQPPATAP